jgi:hypothetical protein
MERKCNKCGEVKDLETCFYKTGRKTDKNKENRHYTCKECTKARVKAQNDANPDLAKDRHLQRTYGISLAEYQDMFDDQSGQCACCNTAEPGGRWNTFQVDHDHVTNEVRQLLCKDCNIVLGIVQDSPEHLMRLIQYLARHK